MYKFSLRCIVILLALLLLSCFTNACADNNQYQVSFTEAIISLPSNWVFGDRNITDNDRICKEWGMTSEEIKKEYLSDDCYACANYGDKTLLVYYRSSDWISYNKMKDEDILSINKGYLNTDDGGKIITSGVVRYNAPFFKYVIELPQYNDLVVYSYITTTDNEMEYSFTFFYTGKAEKANEDMFDSIINSIVFSKKNNEIESYESETTTNMVESYKFGDFFLFTRKNYVYTTRDEKDLDFTSQFVFDHDDHVKALVSYDGFYTQITSYPREHKTALSDNECLVEIIEYAKGGFSILSKTITIQKFADNCYMISGKDDITAGANVEYIEVYVFHKNGIVEISTNHTFVNDGERDRCIAFLKDLASCILPLEEMPKE